jgi:4-amino-4-deoxy-L-arabinose transferase-like glycosyltransferase
MLSTTRRSTTFRVDRASAGAPTPLVRPPLRPALLAGACGAFVKLALSLPFLASYGWDRDELYFLQASRHLSLGYVDFPLITALIGRLTIDLAGPSLVALRLTGVTAGMLAVVLVALCTRELGGGFGAQLLAAFAFVLTPYGLGIGAIFHPTMFDMLVWVAFSYLALRILLRDEPRLWPLLGLLAGIGLETKESVLALLGVFVLALVVLGPRHVLRERRAWLGVAIAAACLAPYVGWEIAHGWPTLKFVPTQNEATAASTSHLAYVAQQLGFVGVALVLVGFGVVELWRSPQLRALAVLAPATSLLFFVEQGRSYYSLPAIALPLAAGAVALTRWWQGSQRRIWIAAPLVVLQLAVLALVAPLVWPVLPRATMIKLGVWQPSFYKDEIGWHQLVAQTARVWRAMPPAERQRSALLAQNYGEAGALALYGRALGLPQPLSGHLSFQYWHPRRMPQRELLVVGFDPSALGAICSSTRVLATINNHWKIANEEQGRVILACKLRRPLGQLWAAQIASDRL